jgi:hypothetical protein
MIGTSNGPCPVDKEMVLDYMENGFLDNIIDLFRHEPACIPMIIDMLTDERIRVKFGATALVEELIKSHLGHLQRLIPQLGDLLKHDSPVVRADSAYVLGMLGLRDALPYLEASLDEDNPVVLEIIQEAIDEIISRG